MSALLERITTNPEIRSGKPVIRGTRMTVLDVLEYMAGGMTEDEILEDFPDLTRDDIVAVLAFAAERERIAHSASDPLRELRSSDIVTIDTGLMSGTPVFTGTRVPVASLIHHLSSGDTLDDFLAGFPGVRREQAVSFLHLAFHAAINSTRR